MSEALQSETSLIKVLKVLLKVIIFILLFCLFVLLGLFIGYVVIGGGKVWQVFNQETWQHIIDFIN